MSRANVILLLALAFTNSPAAAQAPGMRPAGPGQAPAGGPAAPAAPRQPNIHDMLNKPQGPRVPPPPPDLSKYPDFNKIILPPKYPDPTPPRKPVEWPSWVRWEYAAGLFGLCLIGGVLWGRFGPRL
jgi:hypothetical protein